MTHNLTINSPQSIDAHMFLKNYFMRTWIQLSIFLIASPSFCFNCMEHTQVWQWLVLPTLGPTNIFYEFSITRGLHNNRYHLVFWLNPTKPKSRISKQFVIVYSFSSFLISMGIWPILVPCVEDCKSYSCNNLRKQ